jgi:hypothetical protein
VRESEPVCLREFVYVSARKSVRESMIESVRECKRECDQERE